MIKQRKNTKRLFFPLLLLLILFSFCMLDVVREVSEKALYLCAHSLIPSLFPFLVYTEFICASAEGKKFFRLLSRPIAHVLHATEAAAAAYLYGLIFGFPLGIRMLAEGYKEGAITKAEAERFLLFSNNAGPAFLIGAVGLGMLDSLHMGIYFYLLEIVITFTVAFLTRPKEKASAFESAEKYEPENEVCIPRMIRASALNMLSICACVLFFSTLGGLICACLSSNFIDALVLSLLELGTATGYIVSNLSSSVGYALLGFAVSCSGISVYMQAKEVLADTGLSTVLYPVAKLLQGVVAFFITLGVFPFLD